MKRVFGCGLMATLLGTVLMIGVAWSLRCYQSWLRQEIGLEADWTEIETICRQQENLARTLTVSLESLHPEAVGLEELERANADLSSLVLSPEILHEQQRLEEFVNVERELRRRIDGMAGQIQRDGALARQPTLGRLVARLEECHERMSAAIGRFNGKAESFNRRLKTFPDSVVAELAGLRTVPVLPLASSSADGSGAAPPAL